MTRVLVVDEGPPQAGRDGGGARMVALLELLAADGHEVLFASARAWSPDLVLPRRRLEDLGVRVVAADGELIEFLAADDADLDVVILSRLPVAARALAAVRRHAPNAQVIYDAVHAEHLARYRLAKLTGNRPLLAAALADRDAERDLVSAVDGVLATSHEDAAALRALAPGAHVAVVTAVHNTADARPSYGERHGLVFLGFHGMPENEFAVRRLIDEIWPRVQQLAGPTRLTVLGASPPLWLTALAASTPGLVVPGYLPEIDAQLRGAAAMVVPLRGGAGVKSKVLLAFARWLPVVATSDGLRGTHAQDGIHALVGETDEELATAAAHVLREPRLGAELAATAAALHHERFHADHSRAALREILEAVHA